MASSATPLPAFTAALVVGSADAATRGSGAAGGVPVAFTYRCGSTADLLYRLGLYADPAPARLIELAA